MEDLHLHYSNVQLVSRRRGKDVSEESRILNADPFENTSSWFTKIPLPKRVNKALQRNVSRRANRKVGFLWEKNRKQSRRAIGKSTLQTISDQPTPGGSGK